MSQLRRAGRFGSTRFVRSESADAALADCGESRWLSSSRPVCCRSADVRPPLPPPHTRHSCPLRIRRHLQICLIVSKIILYKERAGRGGCAFTFLRRSTVFIIVLLSIKCVGSQKLPRKLPGAQGPALPFFRSRFAHRAAPPPSTHGLVLLSFLPQPPTAKSPFRTSSFFNRAPLLPFLTHLGKDSLRASPTIRH